MLSSYSLLNLTTLEALSRRVLVEFRLLGIAKESRDGGKEKFNPWRGEQELDAIGANTGNNYPFTLVSGESTYPKQSYSLEFIRTSLYDLF